MPNQLATFSELELGIELPLLPPKEELTRAQAVEFPAGAETLHPVHIKPMVQKLPRFSLFQFDDLTIHGFRLFDANGALFTDQSLTDARPELSQSFWRKIASGNSENLIVNDSGHIRSSSVMTHDTVIEDALILASDEPSNFGSWLFRILPKLLLAREAGITNRIFVYSERPWMRDILEFIAPDIQLLRHNPAKSYILRKCQIASLPAPGAFLRQELGFLFDRLIAKADYVERPEKVYLSRRKRSISRPAYRVLENETELAERLIAEGFSEIFPEELPIAAQIAIASSAKIIVGIGGAGMFNCLFARSAAIIIDIESCDTWMHAHINVLSSANVPFSVVKGVQNDRGAGSHRNWTIDVDAFMKGLRCLA